MSVHCSFSLQNIAYLLYQVWNFAHLPMSSNQPYDRFGALYNVTRVLYPNNHTLNPTAYAEYSSLFLPVNYALTYLIAFALTTCVLAHTALYHGPALINGIKRIKVEDDDIHAKLMRSYPEVPDWWYLTVFVLFFVFGLLACAVSTLRWITCVCAYVLTEMVVIQRNRCTCMGVVCRDHPPSPLRSSIKFRLCIHGPIGTLHMLFL